MNKGHENIKGQGFHTDPDRINKDGRPRKYVSLLKEQGYKLSEINDTLMALLSMDLSELKEVFENPKATVLEKAVSGAIRKAIEKGSLYNIETIITRAMGKPKEQQQHTGEITINVKYGNGHNGSGTNTSPIDHLI